MASIHTRVSKGYNARNRFYGPFWQGRYRAKLVETPEYLRQLILYIHLNPVTAEKLDGVDTIIASSPPDGTKRSAQNV